MQHWLSPITKSSQAHSVDLAGLNSEVICFCLRSARIKGLCHHDWLNTVFKLLIELHSLKMSGQEILTNTLKLALPNPIKFIHSQQIPGQCFKIDTCYPVSEQFDIFQSLRILSIAKEPKQICLLRQDVSVAQPGHEFRLLKTKHSWVLATCPARDSFLYHLTVFVCINTV